MAAGVCLVFAVVMGAVALATPSDWLAGTLCIFGVIGAMLVSD